VLSTKRQYSPPGSPSEGGEQLADSVPVGDELAVRVGVLHGYSWAVSVFCSHTLGAALGVPSSRLEPYKTAPRPQVKFTLEFTVQGVPVLETALETLGEARAKGAKEMRIATGRASETEELGCTMICMNVFESVSTTL
jgi:hypothetical protein